jgi:gamma-glutamyltranspeptidase/glutathione hydrolase
MRSRTFPFVFMFVAASLASCDRSEPPEAATVEAPVTETAYIVSAAHPLAVEAGERVLREGGSAVDAAVAVQAVLGLVEPQSSGLAGGAFMLHYDAAADELLAYDGREVAPASAHPGIFLLEDGTPMPFIEAVRSGFSTGVPGVVAMLDMAHDRHGRLAWEGLFAEAEQLADEGFPMPVRMNRYVSRLSWLREEEEAGIYFSEDGAPRNVGDEITNPAYAETVRRIGAGGAAAYYSGPIAEAIIERVNRRTGETTLTLDDFASYRPLVREPICAEVYRRRVCTMPPPSAGGVMLLQIAQLFEMTAGEVSPRDALVPFIEASRLAYADRMRFLGDPTGMRTENMSAEDLILALVSPGYLSDRAELIGREPMEEALPGNPVRSDSAEGFADDQTYERPSTSHFSIRDSYGNVVSMTTTVEFPFGSQMFAGGMALNNQLTDFSRTPGEDGRPTPNAVAPGKRPASSMTPTIVFGAAGQPVIAIGSPGGTAIPGFVTLPLLSHLATGEPLSEAALRPHVVVPRGDVTVEEGADALARTVAELGYEVTSRELTSGLYGFSVVGGEIDLVVDPRREGSAVKGD